VYERERERIHEYVDTLTDPYMDPAQCSACEFDQGSFERTEANLARSCFRDHDGSSFVQPVASISFVTVHTIVGFLAKSHCFIQPREKNERYI